MARKPNYQFEKRQKELERQARKAEKAERRRERGDTGEIHPDDLAGLGITAPVAGTADGTAAGGGQAPNDTHPTNGAT